jgi:hypothetical protein
MDSRFPDALDPLLPEYRAALATFAAAERTTSDRPARDGGSEETDKLDRGMVAIALDVIRRHPVAGLTPETAAAALATRAYQVDEVLLGELLRVVRGGEEAQARAYQGRTLFELLQNAEDACRDAGRGDRLSLWAERRGEETCGRAPPPWYCCTRTWRWH